ncbi:hypothetical protein [Cesiribacter sp. SM1]|uniref:hypothetical protein n=1 Tax=Cesiribacter sp. SM1 TaxID=2861196 RepID=UPI001CD647E2|nr:hypothetical protein [Cesiribacter sp. SM1]
MRTSLHNIRSAEAYLKGEMPTEEALVFEARLLTDPVLRMQVRFQQKAYALLRLLYRKQLKQEATAVEEQLFNSPDKEAFRQQISQLFKS